MNVTITQFGISILPCSSSSNMDWLVRMYGCMLTTMTWMAAKNSTIFHFFQLTKYVCCNQHALSYTCVGVISPYHNTTPAPANSHPAYERRGWRRHLYPSLPTPSPPPPSSNRKPLFLSQYQINNEQTPTHSSLTAQGIK